MAWPVARLVEPARSGMNQHIADRDCNSEELTIAEPGDVSRECRVQGARSDKHASIDDTWSRARNTHDEADCHDAHTHEDKRIPLSHSIAVPCYCYCQDRSCDVNRYRQELRGGAGVSEASDDGWEEERDAVEGTHDACCFQSPTSKNERIVNEHTPIDPDVRPDLPVQECRLDILPLKAVILRDPDCAVFSFFLEVLVLQSVHHKRPLFLCQKRRRLREIVQNKVRKDSHDDRQDSLQNEDPSSTISTILQSSI
jgi:hypothetical protein